MAFGLLKFYLRKAILFRRNCILLLAIALVFGVLVVRITNELTSVERDLAHVKDASARPTQHQGIQEPLRPIGPEGGNIHKKEPVFNEETLTRAQPPLFPVANGNKTLRADELWAWYDKGKVNAVGSPECAFSSHPPARKPTVNMNELTDRLSFDNPDGGVWKQGFDLRYAEEDFATEPLQVFVVPHSHNDPGWLYTFEEYYNKQTRNIFDNIFKGLREDSARKFIYAEMSFLNLWWSSQEPSARDDFQKLLKSGQFEIVTGGWVMNDEANTHYFAMLDQMMEGHWWLKDNLPGVKPRSGWAIDPFGYSPTMAYLLRGMGLENMLIQRVHYAVKKELARNKQLEFVWQQEWDTSGEGDMFCHVMPFYSYDIPHTCGPDPKICCQFDFRRVPSLNLRTTCPWRINPTLIDNSNVQEKATMLLDQYRKKAQLYRTNVLLVPLGDDFRYDDPKEVQAQYGNYEKIFRYFHMNPKLNVKAQFGTLSDYFDALRKTAGTEENGMPKDFPSLTGDFYTYSDRDDHYWSGYYTSRPFWKNFDRVLEANIRSADILYSLAVSRSVPRLDTLYSNLVEARRSLALFQHHDGITGTAKEAVVLDYGNKMLSAIKTAQQTMAACAQGLLSTQRLVYLEVNEVRHSVKSIPSLPLVTVKGGARKVVVYNSLAIKRVELVRFRVDTVQLSVVNENGEQIPCQINLVWSDDHTVMSDQFELVFRVASEGVSLTQYQFVPSATASCSLGNVQLGNIAVSHSDIETLGSKFGVTFPVTEKPPNEDVILSHDSVSATFSGQTGLLQKVAVGGVETEVRADFVMYSTAAGRERSGAYLFLPSGEASTIVSADKEYRMRIVTGPLVNEIHSFVHEDTLHRVILENLPGPSGQSLLIVNDIDIRPESNKELAMRFTTGVQNKDKVFHTDLNGFQLVRRKTQDKLPLQGNYYPIPSLAQIEDERVRLSLHTAQPLGGASLRQGWLEVMQDRRLMQDDNRGLGQGVKDNVVTQLSFRLLLETVSKPAPEMQHLAYPSLLSHATSMVLNHPITTFVASPNAPPDLLEEGSPLLLPALPCDLHLVTMRTHQDTALVLHRKGFACHLDSTLSCVLSDGSVDLASIFSTTLSDVLQSSLTTLEVGKSLPDKHVQVPPMELRTFVLRWADKGPKVVLRSIA